MFPRATSPRLSASSKRIAAATLLALLLAGCPGSGNGRKPPESASPSTTPGVRGGTLRIAVADDAGVLDPQLASDPGALGLIRATQRGLMAFPYVAGPSGTIPVPDLAEQSPSVSADRLTYTFRLRGGVKLGDRALVAADIVAGISRALRLEAASGAFRVIAGADAFVAKRAASVSGLAAPDARTVRVTLTRPVNDVLWMLATPAASAVPPGLALAVSPRDIPSSGPYRLDAWEPGVRMRLVRNSSWSQASDPIRAAWVNAIEVRVGAAKEADLAGEGVRIGGPTVAVVGGCLAYLFLNPHVKPFDRVQVRKGIARIIDFNAAAAALEHVNGAPANESNAILPPGSIHREPSAIPPPDPAEARRMIGSGFSTRIGFERRGPDAAGDRALGTALIKMLAGAGVKATSLLGPGAFGPSAYDLYERGNVPMGIARWCPDWPGRSGRAVLGPLLGSGGVANYSRTSDGELDRLLAAASTTESPVEVMSPDYSRAWAMAEARALALATLIPLAFADEAATVAPRVQGFVPHPLLTRGDPANVWLAS
jgi:peptide/nickel transport system substrate-binding protein